jgi:hypothetical protein
MKRAAIVRSLFSVTAHAPWPEQPPSHPAKTEPAAALAESDTEVPCGKLALQDAPQAIPAGVDATVPAPVTVTVSACCAGPPLFGEPPLFDCCAGVPPQAATKAIEAATHQS